MLKLKPRFKVSIRSYILTTQLQEQSVQIIQKAVGVIRRLEDNRFLISERPIGTLLGGMWEFPGGKVEPGEAIHEALARELQEELGITILNFSSLFQIYHESPQYSVMLHVYLIDQFEGEAQGMEGQRVKWILPEELDLYEFPPASPRILEAVREIGASRENLIDV